MKLASYPEYKDSGQPFLGDIPAHWNLFRNGRLFSQRNETGFGELRILEVSLKTGVRVRDMENLKRKQVMADREKYKRAAQGDIAYNMMRMWQGAVGVAPVDGLVSPAYVVVRPFPEVDCRYFSYLFRTASYMNEVDAYSRGIVKDRNRLYWQDFKRMPSPVPPVDEQRHITRFLDAVGSKAQRFIRNKRRLIELLKEQKQNVINQAVTLGLDPNVRLKPSGVEWIGDIPEHWEITRIGRLLKVNSGDMISAQDEKTKGYPIYGGNEIRGYTDKWNTEGPIILLGRVGAKCGCVHLVYGKFWASEHALRVRLLRKTNLEFLALLLEAVDLNRLAIRTAQPLINSTIVRSVGIALPPDVEQSAIVDHVKETSETIDKAISRAQREIELMHEYRSRLISDVVTGQVDVRGIEVPEVAEEELLALEEDTADDVIDDEGDMDETD